MSKHELHGSLWPGKMTLVRCLLQFVLGTFVSWGLTWRGTCVFYPKA